MAFEKLSIRPGTDNDEAVGNLAPLFEPKISSTIKKMIDKKKRLEIESVFDGI